MRNSVFLVFFGLLFVGFYSWFNYSAIVKWINSPPWYLSEVALKINDKLEEDEWTLYQKSKKYSECSITNGQIVLTPLYSTDYAPYGFTILINDYPVTHLTQSEKNYLHRKACDIYRGILSTKAIKLLDQ